MTTQKQSENLLDYKPRFSRAAVLKLPAISAMTIEQFGVLTPQLFNDYGVVHQWAPRVYIGVDFRNIGSALHDEYPDRPVIDKFPDGCAFAQCRFREATVFGDGCEFCAEQHIPKNCIIGEEGVFRRRCSIGESVTLGEHCEIGVGVTYECNIPKTTRFVRRRSSPNVLERLYSITKSKHPKLPSSITTGTAVGLSALVQTVSGGFEIRSAAQTARDARIKFEETKGEDALLTGLCQTIRQRSAVRDADAKNEGLMTTDILCRITMDAAGQKVLQLFKIEAALNLMCETPLIGNDSSQKQLASLVVTGAQNQLNAARGEVGVRQALLSAWDAKTSTSVEQLEQMLKQGVQHEQ